MPAIVFDLIVLVGVLYLGWLGSAHGLFAAAVTLLEVYAALSLALLLYEPVAALAVGLANEHVAYLLPDSFPLEAWSVFLSFAVLLWGTVALLWFFVHPKVTPADVPGYPAADMGAGFVVAAFAGALTIGGVVVTWSMCPLLGFLRVPAEQLFLDVGAMALRTGGRFFGDAHEGRSLVVYGEPASRESVGEARLGSEVAFDADANGAIDAADPYFDADGNGNYTKDLYYLDVDGDRRRRVGLIEKYTVGRWDGALVSNDRERPSRGQPAPKAGQAAQPPARTGAPRPTAPRAPLPPVETDEFGVLTPATKPTPAQPRPPAPASPPRPGQPQDDF